jgi:acetyl-CoA carboxylase biotin carboxyl carrier protein
MSPEMKDLKELIELLKENKVGEFDLQHGELKVSIKFELERPAGLAQSSHLLATAPAASISAPAATFVVTHPGMDAPSATPTAASASSEDKDASLHIVKSPIVGTFYESPSPGTPAFVKVGDMVEHGKVLCIVEAMKLLNEIESDIAGEVVKRFAESGQPVEYGQQLFAVRPR